MIDAIKATKAAGALEDQLKPVLELQRKAQWRLDFVAAENSMGFHAPQELARILGEAIDLARQAQLSAVVLKTGMAGAASGTAPITAAAGSTPATSAQKQ